MLALCRNPMHTNQKPYRELYEKLLWYDGACVYTDLVQPWLSQQDAERAWLDEFSRRCGNPIPTATVEESWRLYALSRISDLLLLSFAPRKSDLTKSWELADVTVEQYVHTMSFFGLRRVDRSSFHPFFHEIVIVDQTEDSEAPVDLVDEVWPGFM